MRDGERGWGGGGGGGGKQTAVFLFTKECFFLELRSKVVWYSISTKFFRQGTFTSFFTAWWGDNMLAFPWKQEVGSTSTGSQVISHCKTLTEVGRLNSCWSYLPLVNMLFLFNGNYSSLEKWICAHFIAW